ncbi:MAG: cobaltochelatase subunit CobN, partial [Gammaproteobacteria bacterium]|nr:cobaltochelatase subunit CobN [Gammaproteobacteria bacterium]
PGGFVEEEGIIDLGQEPAQMVMLAAAETSLAMLADAAQELGDELPSLRLANWSHLLKPAAYDLYEDKVLAQAQLVLVSMLGGASYWQYGFERLQAWQQAKPGRHLILVPGDDAPDPQLAAASNVSADSYTRLWAYLRHGGVGNGISLLRYCQQTLLQPSLPDTWHEPYTLPQALLYLPGQSQASLSDWRQQAQTKGIGSKAPSVILLFYRSHLQSGNTGMFDGLLHCLQQAGLNPLALAITSLKDPTAKALINHTIEQVNASLVISSLGFANNRVDAPDLSSSPSHYQLPIDKAIPVLQLVLSSTTREAWQAFSQGLRSRDIAMQVVLPEMDGNILTRAISFRCMDERLERTQISLTRYVLEPERAAFVAQLAWRYCRLQNQPNQHKRIALVLANYPTKDGRIGNGVGLDTPASTINILHALKQAGYPIADIPKDGTSLIKALLEAVTNNPNTLHHLPCWQSLGVDDYMHHFQQLPEPNQQQIWQRWGAPQEDPKCRQGRLMIAGIRLGETFVGIQPARGYNLDLSANYHDPDLVPPHSYLAFYFWLRHIYQVEAFIHVGKHGNLEWLPGKGVALSNTCYPDMILGPMPHFYPFIVNDPGEGAQAKRRTQAVIIDHLMPPMARAEAYGDMAALELLVDELYQATGLDQGREQWLRQQIVSKLASSHLQEELGLKEASDEDTLLAQLDAYLCDIKESQIRHGLHILGQLPEAAELAETLVALLRLPRGERPHEQGILHNLSHDFGLHGYDPLESKVSTWQGPRPAALLAITDAPWRTNMDTRERLELMALQIVSEHLLSDGDIASITADLPATSQQLQYARQVLMAALNTSAEQEIQALVQGLDGQSVAPGPSGAPTRGRLDTLPTGRNFFSLDNRSVPSPAAWALGQLSAQALIERHLQEHGDFPQQLGLSVWGTATMRTGGDDIAQAFALMGIKPIWAPGSQRVIDFEIIPAMQLGRPRV